MLARSQVVQVRLLVHQLLNVTLIAQRAEKAKRGTARPRPPAELRSETRRVGRFPEKLNPIQTSRQVRSRAMRLP